MSVRLAERAAIVVLAADGIDNTTIGVMLGLDRVVVGRWCNRFAGRTVWPPLRVIRRAVGVQSTPM